MTRCKAVVDTYRCPDSTDPCSSYSWCAKHKLQHDVSHDFYKYVERKWDRIQGDALWNPKDIQSKKDGLRYLTIVLVARKAHTDWFYKGKPCVGHKKRELRLRDKLISVQRETFAMEHAIVPTMILPMIREVIRSRVSTISAAITPGETAQEADETPEENGMEEFIEKLFENLDPIDLLDINNASIFTITTTNFSFNPLVEPPVDWDCVPASFYHDA
ncbi:hypothetical protein PG996_010538 [Apiospora saccharicola]|uniref:Uncharacterized protein n=1 Tax=Apiospora saccharicola TaxID=335842 RepID=A0ABR1UNW7_9PEZI